MLEELLGGNVLGFMIWIVALVVAISIHEFAHAMVADYLGDPTAKLSGRKTLNPLAHFDPVGTLMLLFFSFGWGKPVPIDPFNLRDPRRDQALISLAGPGSNLILALVLSLVVRLSGNVLGLSILMPIIFLNVTLAIFNLIPLGPLDGFKIVLGFLPEDLARQWQETQSYGIIILLILLFLPIGGFSMGRVVLSLSSSIIKLFLGPSFGTIV